ncbi:MAG: putative bifunctional diguanylate cyclase/phosphodiesterase [Actinomycetota bacterium]
MRDASTLTKFLVVSLIGLISAGTAVWFTVKPFVRARHLRSIERESELLTRVGVGPNVGRTGLAQPIGPTRAGSLDKALRPQIEAGSGYRLNLWNADGRLLYSTAPAARQVGRSFRLSHALRSALAGRVTTVTPKNESAPNGAVSVFTPLVSDSGSRRAAAVEVRMPWEALASQMDTDARRITGLLGACLLGLWAVILILFTRTSRRLYGLRNQVEENERQALRDPLTHLPNRTLFRDRLQQALLLASRSKAAVAILLLDLDHFKEVNDTLGHHHGDLLLQQIGPRLNTVLRDSDTVARLGGDEFGILLANVPTPSSAAHVAEKIIESLLRPFMVQGLKLHVGASIGIAIYPRHGTSADTLMQRADVAMYIAKNNGGGYEQYIPERDDYSAAKLAMGTELRYAIDGNELVLYYQPKVHLRTGRVQGVEALVRWDHPQKGLVAPDDFIGLAERAGLMDQLTMLVLNRAVRQCHEWQQEGLDLTVAVNLSVRNLDSTLPRRVAAILDRWGVPSGKLELEITEGTVMAEPNRAREVLEALDSMGIKIAIDDFGTGHSSLAYLKKLPVNTLKIDKSFVVNMANDENDFVIVQSTVDLAHNLGLEVVAEGVEDENTWVQLRQLGCDLAQGYWKGRPVPGDQLAYSLRMIELPATEASDDGTGLWGSPPYRTAESA